MLDRNAGALCTEVGIVDQTQFQPWSDIQSIRRLALRHARRNRRRFRKRQQIELDVVEYFRQHVDRIGIFLQLHGRLDREWAGIENLDLGQVFAQIAVLVHQLGHLLQHLRRLRLFVLVVLHDFLAEGFNQHTQLSARTIGVGDRFDWLQPRVFQVFRAVIQQLAIIVEDQRRATEDAVAGEQGMACRLAPAWRVQSGCRIGSCGARRQRNRRQQFLDRGSSLETELGNGKTQLFEYGDARIVFVEIGPTSAA